MREMPRDLVGRDIARVPGLQSFRGQRLLPATLIGLLLGALLLVTLRIDLIRVRYDLAAALREERVLEEERQQLTAQLRALSDPQQLVKRAAEFELGRPERILELSAASLETRP